MIHITNTYHSFIRDVYPQMTIVFSFRSAATIPFPDFQLDNIAEVVASMRDEDFGHHYVLNRYIVDHLLGICWQ